MTTNTVVLIAVVVVVAVVATGLSLALTRRLRGDRREQAGGSILDLAAMDLEEESRVQAARVELGIEAFRLRRKNEQTASRIESEAAPE
ncbi:hypothetical protein ACN27E_13580 [Mycobacterium sp. WMMD1722]|uniref:hypothetical protein n=1 Tax=Mycobacterium sp. WMMD1722 TaxID=3404117 RepID=UPI003BF46490